MAQPPAFLLQARGILPLRESTAEADLTVLGGSTVVLLGDGHAFVDRLAAMLAGLEKPWCGRITAGRAEVPVIERRARKIIGFVPAQLDTPAGMTPRGHLSLVAAAGGLGRKAASDAILESLKWCGIAESADVAFERLPRESRYAVGFAGALLHNPSVLIAQGTVPDMLYRQLDELKAVGKAIVLCAGGVRWVPPSADRVALCSPVDLVRILPAGDLARLCSSSAEIRVSFFPSLPRQVIEDIPGISSLVASEEGYILRHSSPSAAVTALAALARANARVLGSLEVRPPSAETLIELSSEPLQAPVQDLFDPAEQDE
jgi:ABC-type Na+ transport system ATPase subunit NatA